MILLAQVFLWGSSVLLAIWARIPWIGVAGTMIIAASILATSVGVLRSAFGPAWRVAGVLSGTILVPVSFYIPTRSFFTWDTYFGILACSVGTAIMVGSWREISPGAKLWLKAVALVWFVTAGFLVLSAGYSNNDVLLFYAGVACEFALFVGIKFIFRCGPTVTLLLNTALLFLLGLPLVDLFARPAYLLDAAPDPRKRYFSYEAAHKDPSAYARWWKHYLRQWDLLAGKIFIPDPARVLPFRLRPNGSGEFFQSRISINSRGFRGKEIPAQKGQAYRIVALGESTTFGCTINRDERPWPDLLEDIIRERLKPSRPVEVINAGVPAYTLPHNVSRLESEIFRLEPDLIISYHGYNGMGLLREGVSHQDPPPPDYKERPSRLLANVEYRLKLLSYKRRIAKEASSAIATAPVAKVMDTRYAKAYLDLITGVQNRKTKLAIANFSMAVSPQSPTDVIEFYRLGFPSVYWQIRANEVHTELVRRLVETHPEICFIDTHPSLNGEHEKFIDLVHLTQEGRKQAAENMFAGIRKVLDADLGIVPFPAGKIANVESP